MTPPPARPKLYHITHVDNLRAMATDGELRCDADIIARGGPAHAIGMSAIKRRRVGVRSAAALAGVSAALAGTTHQPAIEVLSEWYF